MHKINIMKELKTKLNVSDIEIKAEESGKLHIKGYACVFGNIDSYGDIIMPTALDEFLKSDESKRIKFLFNHSFKDIIGVITDKGTDATGLWFEADIIDTECGKDVIKLIKAGAINEFSIGYYADAWREGKEDDTYVRYLDAISIAEISIVTRAANPLAVLIDAKSEQVQTALKSISDEDFEKLQNAVKDEYARRVLALV